MSLVNVWITPAKAMVVVDTEAQDQADGKYFEASKMLTLPHANMVIAGRGDTMFLNVLFSLLHNNVAKTFDGFEDAMPALLAQTMAYLKASPLVFTRPVEEQEATIVGYSQARGAMWCVVYQSRDATGFTEQEIDHLYLSPWNDAWGRDALQATTPHHAQVISQEQVAKMLESDPTAAIGGRLLLAEVTRDGCRLSTLGRVTSRALAR